MGTKPLGTLYPPYKLRKALTLLLPLPADPSRRIPIRGPVSPQRLTLPGESHLE